jgi:hypothetical protein
LSEETKKNPVASQGEPIPVVTIPIQRRYLNMVANPLVGVVPQAAKTDREIPVVILEPVAKRA